MDSVDLSPAFWATDAEAKRQQSRHFTLQLFELTLLVAGAIAVEVGWSTDRYNFSGLLGALALGAALTVRIASTRQDYALAWHKTRGAAESIKSHGWRYAMAGEPYSRDSEVAELRSGFEALVTELTQSALSGVRFEELQVTNWMERSRENSLDRRRLVYVEHRLHNQKRWYQSEAGKTGRAAARWSKLVLATETVAILIALASGLRWTSPGWAGVLGALAAAALAWNEAKRYQFLHQSYSAAAEIAEELAVEASTTRLTEERWALFVAEAEEVFAREHSHWQLRHRDRPV